MAGTGFTGVDSARTTAGPVARPSGGPMSWGRPPKDPQLFWRRRLFLQAAVVGAVGVPVVLLSTSVGGGAIASALPLATLDLSYSFVRMLCAYALSLGFALSYGYFAATTRVGERILIPVLDILQSVPILGFFPFVIVVFVQFAGKGNPIGPNFASIFLIFTSMSWNMAFGVYESLKSLPVEMREATESFGVHGLQRLREVLVPSTINRLVYNSVLSWTVGWYFLVAAEFISTSANPSEPTALPGIGTFLLKNAAPGGSSSALLAGIFVLIVVIALLDLLLWRPLSRWAERFRYDTSPSGEAELTGVPRSRMAPLRRAAGLVVRGMRTGMTRIGSPFAGLALTISSRPTRPRPLLRSATRYIAIGTGLVLVWLLLIYLTVHIFDTLTSPIMPSVRHQFNKLPAALGASLARVTISYLLCVAVAVPLAIALYRRPTFSRVGLPAIEIIASVPATALFPLFLVGLLNLVGPQITSVLMLTTGMIWYIFFNTLSGLRGIPPDLTEAAHSFGLSRREYYRRLVLPAIVPAFITGSITAFGGGWNTLIIAERLSYGSTQSLQVLGLGDLLDVGNGEAGGFPLMVAALLTLIIAVVALNELIWKPLYRRAVERYRID